MGVPINHPFLIGRFLVNHPFPTYGNPHMNLIQLAPLAAQLCQLGLSLGVRLAFFLAKVSCKLLSCFSSRPSGCKGPFKASQPSNRISSVQVSHRSDDLTIGIATIGIPRSQAITANHLAPVDCRPQNS